MAAARRGQGEESGHRSDPVGAAPCFESNRRRSATHAAGGAVLVGLALRARRVVRGRRWITPTAGGFVLDDRRGRFEVPDDAVSDLTLATVTRFVNSVPKRRRCSGAIALREGEPAGDVP